MRNKSIASLAASLLVLAACSNQSNEADPAKVQAQLKPTVVEKQVSNPKSSTKEVDVYCYATDIACYLFKAAYSRLVQPSLNVTFHYQVDGPASLGGRVYYVLKQKDKAVAEQWLKDLNTQNNGFSWASSNEQLSQWLDGQKIDAKSFFEKLKDFESSKEFEVLSKNQSQMAVGAWPFFVRGPESKLLSQVNRQKLLEESAKPKG